MNYLHQIYSSLAAIDPNAPWAALTLCVFLGVYLLRRFFPTAWNWFASLPDLHDRLDPGPALTILWKAWQSLPGMLVGAVVAALGAGGDVKKALLGALTGLAASVTHELMKAYRGGTDHGKGRTPPDAQLVTTDGGSTWTTRTTPINDRVTPIDPPRPLQLLALGAFLLLFACAAPPCSEQDLKTGPLALMVHECALKRAQACPDAKVDDPCPQVDAECDRRIHDRCSGAAQ